MNTSPGVRGSLSMTTDDLLDLVRTYAMERYPKALDVKIIISLPRAEPVTLAVPTFCGDPNRETVLETGADDEPIKITSTERRILKAIDAMKGASPTGEEVAVAAKLHYESHFRKVLIAMRLRGLLGGEKGESGYPITVLGIEAIGPETP